MSKYSGFIIAGLLVLGAIVSWSGYHRAAKVPLASQSALAGSALSASQAAEPAEPETLAMAAVSNASSTGTLSIDGAVFQVGVARTDAEREQGLSGRSSLADDEGLFFIFDGSQSPDRIGIWMKDMNFPIDVVWLDSNLKVVTIVPDMTPASYPKAYAPASEAEYVLEISDGAAQKIVIKEGDAAKFSPAP